MIYIILFVSPKPKKRSELTICSEDFLDSERIRHFISICLLKKRIVF